MESNKINSKNSESDYLIGQRSITHKGFKSRFDILKDKKTGWKMGNARPEKKNPGQKIVENWSLKNKKPKLQNAMPRGGLILFTKKILL